jgi:hypothetical protein
MLNLPEEVRTLLFDYLDNVKKYGYPYVRTFMGSETEILLEDFVLFMKSEFPTDFEYFRITHIYCFENHDRAKGIFMDLLNSVQEFQDMEWDFQADFTEKLWYTVLIPFDEEKKHIDKTMEDYPTMFDVDTDDYLGELEKVYQK